MSTPPPAALLHGGTLSEPPPASAACRSGSPEFLGDPCKESPFIEVFSCKDSRLSLATREIKSPKGLVVSADEQRWYVNICARGEDVHAPHGRSLGQSALFQDLISQIRGEETLDGIRTLHRIDLPQPGIRP